MTAVKTGRGNIQPSCHQGESFLQAVTGMHPVCAWQELDTGVCTGTWGALGAFWSLLGGSPALLGSHMIDFQSHPHSPQLSQGIRMYGRREREMSRPSLPMGHGRRNTAEKTQVLEHQYFVGVMGWQSHGYFQPCLPAHPAAISMSQESRDSRKNYKTMAWVFFSFLWATCSQSMWSTNLCVENPINKTVKHLSCNWIPAHGKEWIWAMANSWE